MPSQATDINPYDQHLTPPGPPPVISPSAPASAPAKLNYEIDGKSNLSDSDVEAQLRQRGYQTQGVSPDGRKITVVDENGPYQIDIGKFLAGNGQNVTGVTPHPDSADYDTVDGMMRAIVSKLPSDDMRKSALEQALQNKGIQGAQVMGSGRDWYYFDPQSNQYKGLTNTPGWDRYDALEAALEIPRVLGAVGGGALAGGASGGLMAAGGAGAGGAFGDLVTKNALSYLSPEYKAAADANRGRMILDTAATGLTDAAGFGVAKGLTKVPGLIGNVASKGVAGRVMQQAGGIGTGIGEAAAPVADMAQSVAGREAVATAMGMGGPLTASGALTLPKAAMSGANRVVSGLGKMLTPEEGGTGLVNWIGRQAENIAPGVGKRLSQAGEAMRAEGVAQDAAVKTIPQKIAQAAQLSEEQALPQPSARGAGRAFGKNIAQGLGASPETVDAATRFGGGVGKLADVAGNLGDATGKVMRGVAAVPIGMAQVGTRVGAYGGKALTTAGQLLSPIESRLATSYAGDKYGRESMNEYLDRLQREKLKAKMDGILVNN